MPLCGSFDSFHPALANNLDAEHLSFFAHFLSTFIATCFCAVSVLFRVKPKSKAKTSRQKSRKQKWHLTFHSVRALARNKTLGDFLLWRI